MIRATAARSFGGSGDWPVSAPARTWAGRPSIWRRIPEIMSASSMSASRSPSTGVTWGGRSE
ncbi:MAG: hypothetical protein HYU25_05880 [Candidatus Rokubacteria bacterium]|nr:hypothetical protein [Candidatus Rokubacteria bacterium]